MSARTYLDNSASSPLDPSVADAMQRAERLAGNPSSLHTEGRVARELVETARAHVAALIHADPEEIVFTGSGTEACNTALFGALRELPAPRHLIVSRIEHPAVLEPAAILQKGGAEITWLPVSEAGLVSPSDVAGALRPSTRLIAVQTANNVVGTIQPITEIGRLASSRGALFFSDAVQAAGRIPVDVRLQGIALLSLSAHKFHGPKGVGALFLRKGVEIEPLIYGGGQERGRRSSTENVAGIVGMGEAARIAAAQLSAESQRLRELREELLRGLAVRCPNAYLIGDPARRLPGHICVAFAGQEGDAIKLLLALDGAGFAVSSGSACSSHHAGEPSHVLVAMGMNPVQARGSLRITLGRFNTQDDIRRLLDALAATTRDLTRLTTRSSQEAADISPQPAA